MSDLDALESVIEAAYRDSTDGWTTERSLVKGRRTERTELIDIVHNPHDGGTLLVCEDAGKLQGCIFVSKSGEKGYFGMFAVAPLTQNKGIGKQLLSYAEDWIRDVFGCAEVEAQVLSVREELLAYYLRRGYEITDEEKPFVNPEKLIQPGGKFVKIRKNLLG